MRADSVASLQRMLFADFDAQAVAELLEGMEGPTLTRKPPRAGRRAMKRLVVIEAINAKDLAKLGGPESACSICR